MLSTKVLSMKADGRRRRGRRSRAKARREATYDYVLVSIGRRPNARMPGLEKTRVQVTDRGFIQTDFQRRTDEPTIFAIGDVAGEPMLAHKASHEARVAVEAIAGHKADLRAAGDSGRRVHRSRDRLGRPHRDAGREGRAARSTSSSSPGARRAARLRSIASTA